MGFSLIYLLESCLLIANALGILSDRFLAKCIIHYLNIYLLFWLNSLKFIFFCLDGMDRPMQNENENFSAKNQVAIMLYFFRTFGKCKLLLNNNNNNTYFLKIKKGS